MSSHLWPTIETSKVSSLWFRPLQTVREDVSLAKFEETLEQERRRHLEKGLNLPFHGRTEMDNGDDDEDGDEAEEESEGDILSLMDNEFAVIKVRKQELNNTNIKSYENNVRISYAYDNERNPSHICIIADSEYIWAQTLQELEWLTVSSIDGVATIRSLNSTVIILYDKTNQTLADFFASLQAMLVHEPNLALSGSDLLPSNQGHAESSMIDELINVINTGAVDQTELIARKIATSKVNVQFNLLNKNDKEETRKAGSKSAEIKKESSDHILELTLSIESLMEHDPIIAPITVSSGTTLQSLKEQIENQSGIKSSSQYWFAFKRYPIPNDYIFGSSLPVVSIQQQQQQQQQPSINYIRSGDTLILYISQTLLSR
ncbi:unnamed protein product [Rotaria magnacalcarata]